MVGLDALEIAVTGAAPIAREVLEWFNAIGVPLSEIYGMSESSGPMCWSPHANRPGSVGQAIPACDVRIADDGEVVCRGGNVFQGYFKDPGKSDETLIGGWLHSGDIGEMDDDGYVRIVDRKKELIITSGGKNISPANLESALKMISLVGQAVAIGDDRKFVSAILALDPEAASVWALAYDRDGVSLRELADDPEVIAEIQRGVDEANRKFATAAQIKRFTVVGEEWLPDSDVLTPTSKLKRRGVNARYATEIEVRCSRVSRAAAGSSSRCACSSRRVRLVAGASLGTCCCRLVVRALQGGGEDGEAFVDLVGRDDEGRHPAHAATTGARCHQDHPSLGEAVGGDGGGASAVVELGADHQTRSAHLTDPRRLVGGELLEAVGELTPALDDVVEETGRRHHGDRRQRGGATDRVAAVRAAVAAARPGIVELAAHAERREGEARGDALRHADHVGLDAVVLDGEQRAGAPEAALHLVGDEQHPVLPAAFDQALDERLRRRDVAALAEHGLEDQRRRLGRRSHRRQQVVEPGECDSRPHRTRRRRAGRGTVPRTRRTGAASDPSGTTSSTSSSPSSCASGRGTNRRRRRCSAASSPAWRA
ncbi:MAG: AMP-binding protein [Ilumatobacteraceae bacterium]